MKKKPPVTAEFSSMAAYERFRCCTFALEGVEHPEAFVTAALRLRHCLLCTVSTDEGADAVEAFNAAIGTARAKGTK